MRAQVTCASTWFKVRSACVWLSTFSSLVPPQVRTLLKRILQNCSDGKLLSCLVLKLVQMENFSQSLFLKIVQMDRHLGFLDVPQPSDPDVKVFHKHCITSNAKQHLKPPRYLPLERQSFESQMILLYHQC